MKTFVASRPKAALVPELPPQPISEEVLLEKYAKGSERHAGDINQRVAQALAAQEEPAQRSHWEARFLAALHKKPSSQRSLCLVA